MGIIQHFKDEEDYTSHVVRDEYDGSVIARIPLEEEKEAKPTKKKKPTG